MSPSALQSGLHDYITCPTAVKQEAVKRSVKNGSSLNVFDAADGKTVTTRTLMEVNIILS